MANENDSTQSSSSTSVRPPPPVYTRLTNRPDTETNRSDPVDIFSAVPPPQIHLSQSTTDLSSQPNPNTQPTLSAYDQERAIEQAMYNALDPHGNYLRPQLPPVGLPGAPPCYATAVFNGIPVDDKMAVIPSYTEPCYARLFSENLEAHNRSSAAKADEDPNPEDMHEQADYEYQNRPTGSRFDY